MPKTNWVLKRQQTFITLHGTQICNLHNNINCFSATSPLQILAQNLHLYPKEMNMKIQSEEGIEH